MNALGLSVVVGLALASWAVAVCTWWAWTSESQLPGDRERFDGAPLDTQ